MPYNTKGLLTDTVAKPIPQYFNPTADNYEPLYGRNGAMRVELYDASGNPIPVTGGKLAVRATELESALGTQSDAEATGNGSLIAIVKRLRTILTDVWNDADNALNVQLTGRTAADLDTRGMESQFYSRAGELAAGTTETVVDIVGREVHIESIAFGSDSMKAKLMLFPRLSDGTLGNEMRLADNDGSTMHAVTPENIQNESAGENDYFVVKVFDTTNKKFSVITKRQIRFGNGVRVQVQNFTASAINVSIGVLVYSKRP